MIDERYQRLMEALEPSQELVQNTLRAENTRRVHAASWKPMMLVALCVLLLVIPVAWKMMIYPPPSLSLTTSTEPFQPTPVSPTLSDDLTLSVSEVTWQDNLTLTFLLTLQGDKVDATTEFDFDVNEIHYSTGNCKQVDPSEGQPENEQCFRITMEINDQLQLHMPESIQLTVNRYTSGNTSSEKIHDINWNDYSSPVAKAGTPLIDLGGGMCISSIGFNDDGWPAVQIRIPFNAESPTFSYPILDNKETAPITMEYFPWRTDTRVEGDYIYNTTAVNIPHEELINTQLITWTQIAGETIRGEWTVTINIPPRPDK